jgi:EAL domain-containing protein (putative c-di-GMP-specific phosphodiesterase class I)
MPMRSDDPVKRSVNAGAAEPLRSPARVLVVEDDDNLGEMYQIVLRTAGFEVARASDGRSALAQYEACAADLVITDLTMPGMDGIDLLKSLRALDRDLPVMIITAAPHVETAMMAVEYGAHRYLQKPVRTAELVHAVRNAVEQHELSRLKRRALAQLDPRKNTDDADLEDKFAKALGELFMCYQPIVSWSERSVLGYEALVRSRTPGMTSPAVLIDTARRIGRFEDLGRRIRHIAPQPLVAESCKLFVNIDASDLMDDTLFDPESALCRIADRVVVELTERVALHGVADACERLARLRQLGFSLAIDDLGAGYAGLSYFAALQPDICKLDMSLVRHVDASSTKQKIVEGMVRMCRELNILLVCEGVETAAERDTLVGLGCDALQGYLFAKPAPMLAAPQF